MKNEEFRMKNGGGIFLTVILNFSLFIIHSISPAAAGEIDIAREALRDGLWSVAREHAAKSTDGLATEITFESLAREGKWRELRGASAAGEDDAARYYSVLADYMLGETEKSAKIKIGDFTAPAYRALATILKSKSLFDLGKKEDALAMLDTFPDVLPADENVKMFRAELLAANSRRDAAEKLWLEVVSSTNVSERAFTVASVNLGTVPYLRAAFEKATTAETHRIAGFALGCALIREAGTLEEGAAIIRRLVKDSPDADGARDAFISLGDAYLALGNPKEALKLYNEALDIWPDVAKSAVLQNGIGWTQLALGKYDAALEAFKFAGEYAKDSADKASAKVKQGDTLSAAGRTDEAMAVYRSVTEDYPDTPAAKQISRLVELRERENEGRRLYREYRFTEAQKIFEKIEADDSSRKNRMEYYISLCLYGQGFDELAIKRAQTLSDECKDESIRAEATLWLAKLFYNRAEWEKSSKNFSLFAELAPSSPEAPEALVWAARAAFADNDFNGAIKIVTSLVGKYPDSPARIGAFLVQGESLIELARFDEAVLVLERVVQAEDVRSADRLRARILSADSLFAMGADNPARYAEALDAYNGIRMGESLSASERLVISYKIAKTMEKQKRIDEAIDRYYAEVVIAYREGRVKGEKFNDDARAAFSRAAFRLVDEHESRGRDFQAMHILELVIASGVPAGEEAAKRIDRIKRKGNFL